MSKGILTQDMINELEILLKKNCPVDTGALRASIRQSQTKPNEWVITIGTPSGEGRDPSRYAEYTETRNKTSFGWVKRTTDEWKNKIGLTHVFNWGLLKYVSSADAYDPDEEEE